MKENSYPLAVLYGYRSGRNELSFVGRTGLITLSGRSMAIDKILRLCNGMTSVRDIESQLPAINPGDILDILSLCEAKGIIRDSRELYIRFLEDSANPAAFSHDLGVNDVNKLMASARLREREGKAVALQKSHCSNVLNVIHKRRSVRQFQDARISRNKLAGLLEATYSIGKNGHWSVPSGGAMYPLDLYLIVPSDKQVIPFGIYRWDPEKCEVVTISTADPRLWLRKVLNARALLENVACILCVAANLRRPALKYANRAYRNILLEAGHAAQNTYLYCAEQNIGVVEYVGFCEKMLARELGLQFPAETVITALIIGTEARSGKKTSLSDPEMTEKGRNLRCALVGNGKPIRDVFFWEPKINGYALSEWGAIASYRPPYTKATAFMQKRCRAFATGATSNEAVIKALAEGFERYALELSRSDRTDCATDLQESYLDPRIVVPFASGQHKMLEGVQPFNPQNKVEWIAGVRKAQGTRVWVPTDLVFYANERHHPPGRKVCYKANSSGVAAHFDKETAVETALFELIERDAFCVMWYAKRLVRKISHGYFPEIFRERISRWESFGYRVSFFDLALDGPPVVLTVIWSRGKRPALFSGAGSRSTLMDAANRAFNEAEFMAMTWHNRRSKKQMRMSDVRDPDDHGLFYADPKNLAYVEWLLEETRENDITTSGFDGDMSRFDPIVVDITPKEHPCGLTVVRILSEKLMPINFGYGSEHYGHSRMKMLGLQWNMEFPSTPHFFA